MDRLLVTLFVISLIIATVLGQGVIIQGPEDAILPVSAQANFRCVTNSSLNVTGIRWQARRADTTWATIHDLNLIGITILPSASKFTSEITVRGAASNNGTELICSVGVFGVLSVQSRATLVLYGAPGPVSGFTSSISGIHSFNLSWIPISFSFPFNYSIWIRPTASNATIQNVVLNQNMTSYIYKSNTSLECEQYNFTIRTVNGAGNSSESGVLTLTLPDVPSSATINNSLVSFDNDGNPLIKLAFSAPRACTDYPVIFYSIILRDQDSSSNTSLMIPAENTLPNDSHWAIYFNNGSIEYDKNYSLSIAAVNDVGVSGASQEWRIVTSNLQSINASLHGYQLRVECHFAAGSRSAGCFVNVVLTNGTELINMTLTRSTTDSLTSNITITLTKDTLSLPLVVVGRDYNITSGHSGLVKITATPTLISGPSTEPIASMTVSMVVESSYELNSQTPIPTFVSPSKEGVVLYVAVSGSALVLGILILLIPLMMSLVVLVRHYKERKNETKETERNRERNRVQPIEPSNGVTRELPKEEQEDNDGTHRDTMNSRSTIRSEQAEAATGSSPVTVLDVDHIRVLMEREGGDTQGLVQPYGVTNLIHKGLEEVPVYQDVQDTDYRKYVATPVPLHSDLPPNPYNQSSETPPLVPPRNQSNRSQTQLEKQKIYHVLESPGSSQGSIECVETPPPLYDEVSAVMQDMQSLSPKTATPTNSPTQTPPLPSRLGCHTNWKRNGATVANGYKEPARVSSSPCFSPSPQLPLHLLSSSSPSPLLTNGAAIHGSDALTPPLPVLRAGDDDDVFSSSASNTIETTPSPVASARHQAYQKLYRRHSQGQSKTMRAVTPHSYAVPSRTGSMPRGYQRPVPRGNYQRQNSCQANLRCHRVYPVVGDAEGVGQDLVNIKKSTSIPSAIMASTSRKRSSSVPGEEEVYNALQYRGYTQGNWTLKRTLV